jgi:hypothetical protein
MSRPNVARLMDAADLLWLNGLKQRTILPPSEMSLDKPFGARPEKNRPLSPFATDPDRSPLKIDILCSNPHQFSDATSGRVKQFDHRLIADAARGVNQPSDIGRRDDARKHLAHSLPSPNEPWDDTIHNAAHIKKIEKSSQCIEVPIVAIDRQVAIHNVDQEKSHVHVSHSSQVLVFEEMTEGEGHLAVSLMRAARKTLGDNPLAEFLGQLGIAPIGDGKGRAQQGYGGRIPVVSRSCCHHTEPVFQREE